MSSATPAAFWSAMSITTTSASCFSATPRATVAPTFPAPPTTVTLRFIAAPRCAIAPRPRRTAEAAEDFALCPLLSRLPPFVSLSLHVLNDVVAELRRLQLRRAVHQAREVVRHPPGADRAFHAFDDQVRYFAAAEMPEHHLARENHRAQDHLHLVRVFRRSSEPRHQAHEHRHIIDV